MLAQLDAGSTAVAAGAVDTGLAALRSRAVIAARAVHDPALLARTLLALGSAMVHGVRGADQEGLALLHDAAALADDLDGTDPAGSARAGDGLRGLPPWPLRPGPALVRPGPRRPSSGHCDVGMGRRLRRHRAGGPG